MRPAFRYCCSLLLLAVLQVAPAADPEEPLPRITPEFVSEIQRLALTLRLTEFPLTQQQYREHLELPRFVMGYGLSGRGIRDYQICFLSDPTDPLGCYGFHIYWGPRQSESPNFPVIESIELFFKPANQGHYPPIRAFVLPHASPDEGLAIGYMRNEMRELNLTPGAYVRQYYARNRKD